MEYYKQKSDGKFIFREQNRIQQRTTPFFTHTFGSERIFSNEFVQKLQTAQQQPEQTTTTTKTRKKSKQTMKITFLFD